MGSIQAWMCNWLPAEADCDLIIYTNYQVIYWYEVKKTNIPILIGCVADTRSQQLSMLHKRVRAHFVAHEELVVYSCSKEYWSVVFIDKKGPKVKIRFYARKN